MPKSVFISLDGLDGTGKSTQCRLLVDWLVAQKVPVTACTDPGGTALGLELRQILLHSGEHRMAIATEAFSSRRRAQLVEEVIRPALDRGEVVVSDRFTRKRGVSGTRRRNATAGPLDRRGHRDRRIEPDLTLVFDMPLDLAFARRNHDPDRMEARDRDFHQAVKRGFTFEAGRRPEKHRIIDVSKEKDVDAVQRNVRREVGRVLVENGWSVTVEG